jgi:glycosyltransferase involved in cell wall biosynthesis
MIANLRPTRILEVVEASGAGVGRHVSALCKGLVTRDQEVTVAYAPYRVDEAFQRFLVEYGNEIRFVPLTVRREISPVADLRAVSQLMNLIREEGPFDVVHGHSAKGGAIARIAGRWCGIPTVYTPHALIMSSPEISRAQATVYTLIERALGHYATSKIIAVSEEERRLILELGLVPTGRVELIKNGLDDQDIQYFSEAPDREDTSQQPLTFGSTMRFIAQKAPDHLIAAFSQLSATLPQLPMRLVIAGDGELFDEIRRNVETSDLHDKILLLGWRADAKEVLRQTDVFVVSSLYEAGCSYSTMEAMAAGLPIVSTNVFGAEETLSQVPGNVLVPVGDPGALAEGMKQLITQREPTALRPFLHRVGRANRDHVSAHFKQSEAIQRTLEIYQMLR